MCQSLECKSLGDYCILKNVPLSTVRSFGYVCTANVGGQHCPDPVRNYCVVSVGQNQVQIRNPDTRKPSRLKISDFDRQTPHSKSGQNLDSAVRRRLPYGPYQPEPISLYQGSPVVSNLMVETILSKDSKGFENLFNHLLSRLQILQMHQKILPELLFMLWVEHY